LAQVGYTANVQSAPAQEDQMAFIFGKLAFWVLRPSNFLLFLSLLGLAGLWRHPRSWARAILAFSLGFTLLLFALPVGNWLLAPLEERFPKPAALPPDITGAVILGGGVLPLITRARGSPAFGDTGERYMAMLELARRYPEARLIFTGGSGQIAGERAPEIGVVEMLLEQHGLAGRVELEGQARSTRENALYTKELAQPKPGDTWLLVTSAGHMPRSMAVFRGVGWELQPWPVDYRTVRRFELEWNPDVSEVLYELDEAAYEWMGLVYYRLLGWTRELYPGPPSS
jgi:uncharacterized SAM-binding protein YcdF (DUF218 family)